VKAACGVERVTWSSRNSGGPLPCALLSSDVNIKIIWLPNQGDTAIN